MCSISEFQFVGEFFALKIADFFQYSCIETNDIIDSYSSIWCFKHKRCGYVEAGKQKIPCIQTGQDAKQIA